MATFAIQDEWQPSTLTADSAVGVEDRRDFVRRGDAGGSADPSRSLRGLAVTVAHVPKLPKTPRLNQGPV
jgi:hypothetical protein